MFTSQYGFISSPKFVLKNMFWEICKNDLQIYDDKENVLGSLVLGEDKGALEDLEQSLDNSDFYNATSTKEYCVSIIEKPAEKALASAFGLIAICTNDSMVYWVKQNSSNHLGTKLVLNKNETITACSPSPRVKTADEFAVILGTSLGRIFEAVFNEQDLTLSSLEIITCADAQQQPAESAISTLLRRFTPHRSSTNYDPIVYADNSVPGMTTTVARMGEVVFIEEKVWSARMFPKNEAARALAVKGSDAAFVGLGAVMERKQNAENFETLYCYSLSEEKTFELFENSAYPLSSPLLGVKVKFDAGDSLLLLVLIQTVECTELVVFSISEGRWLKRRLLPQDVCDFDCVGGGALVLLDEDGKLTRLAFQSGDDAIVEETSRRVQRSPGSVLKRAKEFFGEDEVRRCFAELERMIAEEFSVEDEHQNDNLLFKNEELWHCLLSANGEESFQLVEAIVLLVLDKKNETPNKLVLQEFVARGGEVKLLMRSLQKKQFVLSKLLKISPAAEKVTLLIKSALVKVDACLRLLNWVGRTAPLSSKVESILRSAAGRKEEKTSLLYGFFSKPSCVALVFKEINNDFNLSVPEAIEVNRLFLLILDGEGGDLPTAEQISVLLNSSEIETRIKDTQSLFERNISESHAISSFPTILEQMFQLCKVLQRSSVNPAMSVSPFLQISKNSKLKAEYCKRCLEHCRELCEMVLMKPENNAKDFPKQSFFFDSVLETCLNPTIFDSCDDLIVGLLFKFSNRAFGGQFANHTFDFLLKYGLANSRYINTCFHVAKASGMENVLAQAISNSNKKTDDDGKWLVRLCAEDFIGSAQELEKKKHTVKKNAEITAALERLCRFAAT